MAFLVQGRGGEVHGLPGPGGVRCVAFLVQTLNSIDRLILGLELQATYGNGCTCIAVEI